MKKEGNIIILKDSEKDDKVELSKIFRKEYLNFEEDPELINQSILVTNLLFQIILDLKGNMFHKDDSYLYDPSDKRKNQLKLDIWQNEVLDSDKNEIKKVYKTSFFLKNRDKKQMIEALDFLKSYKYEKYTFVNGKGEKITTSAGLIKDWYFFDKTGNFQITISLYWANRIVTLENGQWNNSRLNVIKEFTNNKQRFFVLWLMEVKKYSGTSKKFQEILNVYNLNYKTVKKLMREFLAPIKAKLDNKIINNNWISFNYYLDENNNIKFVPYDIKPKSYIEITAETQKKMTLDNDKFIKDIFSYKIKYIKRRHSLSNESAEKIKDLYLKKNYPLFEYNYKKFLSEIKKNKETALDYQDEKFIKKIEEVYLCTIS